MKTSQLYLKLTKKLLLFLLFTYHIHTTAQTTAINDTIYIENLNNITIDILSNDIIEIGQNVTIEIVDYPAYGTIEINQNNRVIYIPNSNFISDKLDDNFSYTINGISNEGQVVILISDCPACVWPGDTDQNGSVDVWDLIPIGLAYNATGTPRASQNTSWSGYPTAEDWGIDLYGSDYKYIDCNGDGTIDENDVEAIDQNYEAVHSFATMQEFPNAGNDSFDIALNIIDNGEPISWGDTVTFEIKTGLAGQEAFLYGMAFSFTPPQGFIQSATVDFLEAIGNEDNTISLSKTIANGTRFDAAIVRTDQNQVSFDEETVLGKINVVMVEVLEGKTGDFEENISINLDNFKAINAAGESLMIDNVYGDSFLFVGTKNVIKNDVSTLKVYPNPTQDILTIILPPLHDFRSLEIIDISGKTVLQQNDLRFITDKINIDTKGLNNGFYLLKMQMAETQVTQKISILRY